MFTVMPDDKSSQLLPRGQFSLRHTDERRSFHRGKKRLLCEWTKGISFLLRSLLPLNPIMCRHASPTRLFPSYRQHWLPILFNCLLCKSEGSGAPMRASCPSPSPAATLTDTFPKEVPPEKHTLPLWNYTAVFTKVETSVLNLATLK